MKDRHTHKGTSLPAKSVTDGVSPGGNGVIRWVETSVFVVILIGAIVLHVIVFLYSGGLWRDEVTSLNISTLPTLSDLWGMLQFESFPILWPLRTPFIARLCNKILVKIWPFKLLAMTNFVMARPNPEKPLDKPLVSVIVAARNEVGNISDIFSRTPEMGSGTELVFVEGHSGDDTFSVIEKEIEAHQERRSQLHRQTGVGKGDAVRMGFAQAKGDILMILDADMTVPPEDLPRFYEALHGRSSRLNACRKFVGSAFIFPFTSRGSKKAESITGVI